MIGPFIRDQQGAATNSPARRLRHTFSVTLLALTALLASSALAQRPDQGARPQPRIAPVAEHESNLNVVKTIARHPALLEAWQPFGGYVLRGSTLPARDRELLILTTGWLCQADYEWGHHVVLAREAGLSEEEIARIVKGPQAGGWSSFDRALVRAAHELHRNATMSDRTWAYLKARYSDQQMMDVVFTVGEYTMVSMALNSFRVQLEDGFEGLPSAEP